MDEPSPNARATHRQLFNRLLPALLLLASSGCGLHATAHRDLTPPMPVQAPLRKQVLQGYMPFGSIGWVNNEQVVFHGFPVGAKGDTKSLYLWDLQGHPQKLLAHSHGSCVKNNEIHALELSASSQARSVILRGPEFKPIQKPLSPRTGTGMQNPINCEWVSTPKPLRTRNWWPLDKEEGFLDFGPGDAAHGIQQVLHLSKDLLTHEDTGIRMRRPLLPKAMHAAHDDSYLIFDLNISQTELDEWRSGGERRIWRLDLNFLGTPIDVPYGEWSNQDISFRLARTGLLIISNNFTRKRDAGGAGLYLFATGKPARRLERGLVQEAAVSPDGCRVAYGFRPRLDTGIPEGGPRLVVLDLCGAITPIRR